MARTETAETVENVSFEVQMSRLEALVRTLEQGDLPLEQALAAFEQGNLLVQACRVQLEAAELKVEQVLNAQDASDDGEARSTTPFRVD